MPASYKGKHTTHFVGINRAKHKQMALAPSRKVLSLYHAIEKVGLTYEREPEFDAGDYPIWFNAKVQLADGRMGIIFLHDDDPPSRKYNPRVRKRKLEFLANHPELPALECWEQTSDQIAAQISLWLATIRVRPQKICDGKRPVQKFTGYKQTKMTRNS